MGTAITAQLPARIPLREAGFRVARPRTARAESMAVYVHFPWCLAKCPYCDFVSYAKPRDAIDHDGYANAVVAELEARAEAMKDRGAPRLGSVFFGGGTPSLWEARALGRVLSAVLARFEAAPDLEITVECNPTSLDRDVAEALADEGVTRLSIGAQSLRADQLKYLGRLHDPEGARKAIDAALGSSIRRVSADMIFGLPEQTPEDARSQAEALVARGLSHVSCYQLTIEPGTRFGELAKRGRLPRAEDGIVAESFLLIDEALSSRGFAHYEISNYARPGEEARHNLAYWRGDEYLGLGCAAVGFVRDPAGSGGEVRGLRYRNTPDPAGYVDAALRAAPVFGTGDAVAVESEPLDGETLLRERIMLGLRLEEGVDLGVSGRELGVCAWTAERERTAKGLVERGRLERDGDRLRIPRRAWLWTDDTAARLF